MTDDALMRMREMLRQQLTADQFERLESMLKTRPGMFDAVLHHFSETPERIGLIVDALSCGGRPVPKPRKPNHFQS